MLPAVNCRLVATHYPHHCLVGDWLDEELSRGVASAGALAPHATSCSVDDLSKGSLFFVSLSSVIRTRVAFGDRLQTIVY